MPDDEISLTVDKTGMQATLHLPAGASLPVSTLLDRMMKINVIGGVVEPALREAEVPADVPRDLIVAQGTPVVPSIDARIEMLVHFGIKLAEGTDHKIDFHEQGRFHEVEKGDVLARYHPKKPGTPGRTVMGKDLPVGEPRDADVSALIGEGVARKGNDVVADRTGMVIKRHDGHLDIMPSVQIDSDLNMRCGNLTTKLPVAIKGDVIAGFTLKSGADVTITGVIEDARVSVKGNLHCGGILPGTHRVKAHGDIVTKHINRREVKCRGLQVASDIRGSTVYAIKDIAAKAIMSSTVSCGGSLTCDELGSLDEMGGVIQIGVNPLAIALWRLAAREHETIAGELEEAKRQCKKLALWIKQETDEGKRQELATRLKQALAEYEARGQRLAECEAILNNATLRTGNSLDATITVHQKVWPGIEIRIGTEAKLTVTKALGKTVFRLVDGKITWE
ncbi:MAG: DUF342 domain-containing protein [Planctomycetes bacterium]|nr:DUF342 domain-containing protein [Planctomycetota bacterium]